MPTVSVIVPHFNRQDLIVPTLESLNAQSFVDWELIVVDDASLEDPTALVQTTVPGARVILQPENRGPAAARNAGIDAARGRFVAFLDSDDHWEPEKLERQITSVLAAPNPDAIFCAVRTRVVDAEGRERVRPSRPVQAGEKFADFLYVSGEFAQSSSMLLTQRVAAKVRFREDLRQYEDHMFFIECGNAGLTYLLIEESLVVWRNDNRPDRLGHSDNLDKGQHFLNVAGDALSERACLAFQTRFLGPRMLRKSPVKAVKIAFKALHKRAVSPRDIVLLLVKTVMPAGAYAKLKSQLR
ncbi:glycosyltransferase family 2 protein [Sphingobium sp. AR-3-1]|uniref:Glycosyltransferase family 2 protein n=1 Tax=Sphingobium psychrophilum TaxID=2728834 RepID=A0A7X9WZL7_9SPHN|nr:glycosyltransferase family 2 protein [Sphingobium psychrophilum]NML12856.1 glycosyltransferase family 2 protein [Sphingobium psychrophilum]